MDATRALLDQLMGKDRNLTSDEKPKKIKWSDSSVCQNFLAGFCVNALFTNTKSDLGPCHLSHEPSIKAEFDAEPERVKQPVIANFIRYLETLAYQCDQQMKRNQQRVQLEDQPLRTIPDPQKETQIKELETKINQMNDNIKTLLTQMETLGEEGKIDESQGLLKLVEGLRKEKADLEVQKSKLEPDRPAATPSGAIPEKKLKVCEICSAFLVSHDAEARWQSHASGKQHMGYALIRDTIKEYKEKHKNLPEPATDPLLETRGSYNSGGRSSYYDQPRGGYGGRGGYDRGYDRNSDRGYDRDRDRGYDRYDRRDRGYDRDRDRDYGRDRDRDRDRDYGRDRDRSERDRERRSSPRRDRSRSRSRSRSKGKK